MLRSAALFACLVALLACGNDEGDGGEASASSRRRPEATEATTTTTAAPTTTTTTTRPVSELTTVPAPPAPADGGNVDACFDGSCDVQVTLPVDVPIDPALHLASLRLRLDERGGVSIEAMAADGTAMNSATGPGGVSRINNVQFQVEAVDGMTARIIMTACADIEGCEPVTPRG